jgi:CheY-like chemotaxis protein
VKHVLLVEDDENNAILIRRLLEKCLGCRVSVSASPDDVMALLDRDPVAAIVMDVSLNDARLAGKPCNGAELSRHIRGSERHHAVPILLATAHAMRGDSERLLAESGANAYITKPFASTNDLIEPLRKLLAA